MTTAATKIKTPDRLMDTAQTLFVEHGYHGVSVDKIIAATQVSKGTFFYHFKSKEDLAERLLARYFERIGGASRRIMTAALALHTDPRKALETCLNQFETLFDGTHVSPQGAHQMEGCLMAAFSYELFQAIPSLREVSAEAIQRFSDATAPLFANALATAKTPVETQPDVFSKHYFALMQGTLLVNRINPNWTDHKQQIASFKLMFNALLK